MADKDISVLNPATNQYEPLKPSNNPEEESSVGNGNAAPRKGYIPEAVGYIEKAENDPTPEVTATDVAINQAKINNITNGANQDIEAQKKLEEQNQTDAELLSAAPITSSTKPVDNSTSFNTKSAEKPVENYPPMKNGDVRKDVGNYLNSPLSYNGAYADLYEQFGDLGSWLTQLDNFDLQSSDNGDLIENLPAHLIGALKFAKENGISNDKALFNLTAVAQAARNGDAKAGIDYFLTTGIVKNKAAAKYIDDVREARDLLDNGKINEDQYKEALGNIAQDIVKNEKYFDRSSNVQALTDSLLELGGYLGGVLAVKGGGKLLSKIANSKLGKKLFTETKFGKAVLNSKTKATLNKLYDAIEEKPISKADAEILEAATEKDNAIFLEAYEKFSKLYPNGDFPEFSKYIEGLPQDIRDSIIRSVNASDTFAKVNPEAFAYEMLSAHLDPNIAPEAVKNQYDVFLKEIKDKTKFNLAELARFLRANSAEQAGGIAGVASAYLKGLASDPYTTSDNVTGGKGAEGTEPMPSRETTPINQNKVDNLPKVRTSKYLLNSPEVEEAYNRVQEAEKAYNDAPAYDKAVAKKALDEAINDYNNKLNAAENDLTKDLPNKLRAMDNNQVNMRQFWKSSLGRSILDAYVNGEITGGQAIYFGIQALSEGILNASRGIATGIHGEGLQDMKPSTWDTLQKTRTSEAYSFRNQQLNQMANDQLNYVSEIFKLDADSQKKVRDLMSDAITRNYYNKLDDSRKLEFIELLAAYAPKYVRFNDDQKKVFRQIMMESGQITPDDINLMISQFGMSGIAGLIRQGKESMMRSEYWKSVSNQKEVEKLEKDIDILESEGKIKSQEAEMYKLKLYTEASRGGIDVLKEILNLARNR